MRAHALDLKALATERVLKLPQVALLGSRDPAPRGRIVNFGAQGTRGPDLARILYDSRGVAMRYGRRCMHAWSNSRDMPESIRVSFVPYNTRDEAEASAGALGDVLRYFR